MRKILISIILGILLTLVLLPISFAEKIKKLDKIVVFRFESPDSALSSMAREEVLSRLRALKKFKVIFYNENPSPKKMSEICKDVGCDAIMTGFVNDKYKYKTLWALWPLLPKMVEREKLLNVRLKVKLIEPHKKRVLWRNVQNSHKFIFDQSVSYGNLKKHVGAVAEEIVNQLEEFLDKNKF